MATPVNDKCIPFLGMLKKQTKIYLLNIRLKAPRVCKLPPLKII